MKKLILLAIVLGLLSGCVWDFAVVPPPDYGYGYYGYGYYYNPYYWGYPYPYHYHYRPYGGGHYRHHTR